MSSKPKNTERDARIVRAGRDDPGLSLSALAERFDTSTSVIGRVLEEAGVRRENPLPGKGRGFQHALARWRGAA